MKKKRRNARKVKTSSTRRARGRHTPTAQVKDQMLGILLRRRSETLGQACKKAGITPTTFYYRLKHATFGSPRRGKEKKVALSALDAKRLMGLIRRQERLQTALNAFTRKIR